MLLIPLEIGSRGDQVENARCFTEHGVAHVLREGNLDSATLRASIDEIILNADKVRKAQKSNFVPQNSAEIIFDMFETFI